MEPEGCIPAPSRCMSGQVAAPLRASVSSSVKTRQSHLFLSKTQKTLGFEGFPNGSMYFAWT